MKDISTVKNSPPAIEDNGTGYTTPPFPPVHAEPATVAYEGKVMMGGWTPLFPAAPAK